MTRIELVSPMANDLSPEMRSVLETSQLKSRIGEEYWIELGFDGESQGKQIDLRPELPLVLNG